MASEDKSMVLYHYTSLETFRIIIKTLRIKLSDLTKSNDSSEIIYYGAHLQGEQKEYYDSLIKEYVYYGFCLTELKDDLHMWSCYGNGGVAIGFDKEKLQRLIDKHLSDNLFEVNKRESNFGKVKYDEFGKNRLNENANSMVACAFVKHPFFMNEKEWRIVIPASKRFLDDFSKQFLLYINGLSIPFDLSVIKEVVMAPNCYVGENGIKEILNGCSGVLIKKSKGSYR